MNADRAFTQDSILAMATEVKDFVGCVAEWMRKLKELPVEAARAEYKKSPAEVDDLVAEFREADSEQLFVEQISFSESRLSPAEVLLLQAIDVSNLEVWIPDHLTQEQSLLLGNCAYSPDFMIRCGTFSSRGGFDFAVKLGEAVCEFLDYASAIEVRYAENFRQVLEGCEHDRRAARSVLPPDFREDAVDRLIDYETSWLLCQHCSSPEPRPWVPETDIAAEVEAMTRVAWHAEKRELFVNGKCVATFGSQVGKTLRTILDAFEEEGWPDRIDDPTTDQQKRKDAIRTLNKKFPGAHFSVDEDQITWKNTD